MVYSAVAALLLTSTAALAFQEQSGGSAAAVQPKASAEGGVQSGLAAGGTAKRASEGTEVRIPGLGRLGVLPKMDFGLELLYGATESAGDTANQFSEPDVDGDLKVRGTVKHRF